MPVYEHACRATQGARDYQEDMAAFLVGPDATGYGSDEERPFEDGISGESVPGDDGVGTTAAAPELVAVLADGMGGHAAGDVASRLVCERFIDVYDATEPGLTVVERMTVALEGSNTALADKVAENPLLSGMGSTLIGTVFGSDGVEWISVGDSPLYLYRRGEIAPLNADHSLAPELDLLAAAGHMTREAALSDPRRHMLRSAVTGEEITMLDVSQQPTTLYPGDYVILASDGLQTLEPDEIARVIQAYAEEGPAAVAEALIRAVEALRAPHQDNATVVAVRPVWDDAD